MYNRVTGFIAFLYNFIASVNAEAQQVKHTVNKHGVTYAAKQMNRQKGQVTSIKMVVKGLSVAIIGFVILGFVFDAAPSTVTEGNLSGTWDQITSLINPVMTLAIVALLALAGGIAMRYMDF